jgi:hypothetical protein
MKLSTGKSTLPGRKQIFRYYRGQVDVIGRHDDQLRRCCRPSCCWFGVVTARPTIAIQCVHTQKSDRGSAAESSLSRAARHAI